MFPSLRLVSLLCVAVTPALAARPLTMEQSVALALEQSPRLIEGRADAASAQARLEGASLLLQNNPQLQAAVGPRLRDEGDTLELNVGLSQQLEVFGQRAARKDAARATAAASQSRLEALQVDLAAEVRRSFGRALAAERALQLSDDALGLAEEGRKTAEERLKAGAASHIEVNIARVELGRAQREKVRATQERIQALAELKLLLNLDPDEDVTLEGELRADVAPAPAIATLIEQAARQRQDLRAARADWEAARAEVRFARRDAMPRPSLGVSYGREEGDTIVQGTLSIDLPLFNQNQAGRGASAARKRQAQLRLDATERFVHTEVELALNRYRAAQAMANVFGADVLDALQENLSLVTEAYRAGKVDYLQLLIIRREALDGRRGYIEALEELNAANAQLMRAVGTLR
ncbi:TolC family protein [Corallococcus macrosporus]|uniref:Transporter n=1 Tax=Corallococcus macrosporus DSM 14697 TaxID=1189310 RepID=A0A250JWX9_9BACT|nr:TolC family protein [Corallococcus macrosporus]ATB47982.1 transporter [Corallococcus macrosporus DSM 14697]